MRSIPMYSAFVLATALSSAGAQSTPPEIAALRQQVATIRAQMSGVTASAEYVGSIFTRDTGARLMVSGARNPGLIAEFAFHSGGPPEFRDADDWTGRGVVLVPVAAWENGAFGVAALIDRWLAVGRPVVVIGSQAGKPDLPTLRYLVPNGAPDGSRANTAINEAANLIAAWAFYVEFVASATRHNWQPGILASIAVPSADDSNAKVRFRTPRPSEQVAPIAAGRLGNQYLDRIDSLLTLAARPEHLVLLQRAADSLRAVRLAGHRVFVGACGNYLQRSVIVDSIGSPFRPVLAQYDVVAPMVQRGARPGDAILWFGYHGYDCPHLQAASPLKEANFKVVTVSDNLPAQFPANVMAAVPLGWRLPEHVADVPFNGEGVGSASSVDALLHYLILRRLVGLP